MDCLLMRHGIAVESDEWSGEDETRPLTEQGREKVCQVAMGLAALGVIPTHLFTSPLTRARETTSLVQAILCPTITETVCNALEPSSSSQSLMITLRTVPNHSVILCVGHEPLLGAMAGYLLNGHTSQNYPIKKAGVGLIYLPSTVRAGEGLLRWWCTPAQLRTLGKAHQDDV